MLTRAIPEDIWSAWPCFIVHPGPMGDRGPSSLDWAIMGGAGRWGVTVLQANAEMDAGDIWASVEFAMPGDSKSSTYRTEVADAAVEAVLLAVARFAGGRYRPEPLDYSRTDVTGQLASAVPPARPRDRLAGRAYRDGAGQAARGRLQPRRPGRDRRHASTTCSAGTPKTSCAAGPGSILARRDGAICRATVDGAVWIPQLRRRPAPGGPGTFKLPATLALGTSAGRRARRSPPR